MISCADSRLGSGVTGAARGSPDNFLLDAAEPGQQDRGRRCRGGVSPRRTCDDGIDETGGVENRARGTVSRAANGSAVDVCPATGKTGRRRPDKIPQPATAVHSIIKGLDAWLPTGFLPAPWMIALSRLIAINLRMRRTGKGGSRCLPLIRPPAKRGIPDRRIPPISILAGMTNINAPMLTAAASNRARCKGIEHSVIQRGACVVARSERPLRRCPGGADFHRLRKRCWSI